MSANNVVAIGRGAPDQELIKFCRDLLAQAESGELRSLVWAGNLSDGRFARGLQTDDAVEAAGLAYMMLHGIGHNRMLAAEED